MKAANGFREDELVSRKQKMNGEWIETYFPRVGGRLRLAHEHNGNLSISTEVVRLEDGLVVVKATACTEKGSFSGFGTASAQRDARLADSLLELAETRSIARALRFSGYGMEFTGAEEMSHVIPEPVDAGEQKGNVESVSMFQEGNGNGKTETKSEKTGKATQAQCRALYELSRKAKMQDEDIHGMLSPPQVERFEDLALSDASRLIQYLQTEVSAA